MSGVKKSSLISIPFLKKRLRRITAFGFNNLTINEFNFTIHFTLHRNEKTNAFYTSEPIENQHSPEWFHCKYPANAECLQEFLMRVWITSSNECRLFLEYNVHLNDNLIPDEKKNTINIDNNTLWIEMFGYRFTDSTDNESNVNFDEDLLTTEKLKRLPPSKFYNKLSIIRMNTVISAIRTEKQVAVVYLQKLEDFYQKNENYRMKIKERESRQLRIEHLKTYLTFVRTSRERRSINNREKRLKLNETKNQLNNNSSDLLIERAKLISYQQSINQSKTILRNLLQINFFRQKQIINEIYQYVYPIHKNVKGEYSITDIVLLQADDKIYQSGSSRNRDHEIAAAIRFCSHIVLVISKFIQFPLRYPIDFYGVPEIKIYDYTLELNEYPLYPTSNLSAFRYGFYLLNRNIGQIMYHCRINDRYIDIRNTLENLKYLIEQYFINSNNKTPFQFYPSIQMNLNDEQSARRETDSTSLSLSSSDSSSLVDNNDLDFNEKYIESLSEIKTYSPRLVMQVSQQLHY